MSVLWRKMKPLCLQALSPNYDFLLITDNWLGHFISDNVVANPDVSQSEKIAHLGVGLPIAYARDSVLTLLCQSHRLNCIQEAIRPTVFIDSEVLLMERMRRLTDHFKNNCLSTNDVINFTSLPLDTIVVAVDLNAPVNFGLYIRLLVARSPLLLALGKQSI